MNNWNAIKKCHQTNFGIYTGFVSGSGQSSNWILCMAHVAHSGCSFACRLYSQLNEIMHKEDVVKRFILDFPDMDEQEKSCIQHPSSLIAFVDKMTCSIRGKFGVVLVISAVYCSLIFSTPYFLAFLFSPTLLKCIIEE